MSNLLHDLKWNDVSKYLSKKDIILFPVGSTEQHGQHLPLVTDCAWAVDVAQAVADREKVLICPPLGGLPIIYLIPEQLRLNLKQ
jgi:creatinine amidohydrolase